MRVDNWPTILFNEIERAQIMPFIWGSHDCALFACRVVEAMTGVDHGASFRGRYDSERGAAVLIKDAGGLRQIATDAMGAEIPPLMARRGDVVLILQDGERETLGVCIGAECAVPGIDGLMTLPITAAIAAWRVE
jgi:hypothetical protein